VDGVIGIMDWVEGLRDELVMREEKEISGVRRNDHLESYDFPGNSG
jgi:hypothetical protein